MVPRGDARQLWLTLLIPCGAAALLGVGAVMLGAYGHSTADASTSPLFPAVGRGIEGLNGWSVVFLAVAGFLPGLFGRAHPLLVGLSTMALFPLMTIADVVADSTSHNLLPFEWAMYCFLTAPGVLGAFAGRRFRRSLTDEKA